MIIWFSYAPLKQDNYLHQQKPYTEFILYKTQFCSFRMHLLNRIKNSLLQAYQDYEPLYYDLGVD